MTQYQHLLVDTSPEGVRTITLNRPDRLNAVNPILADELPRAVLEAHADDAVRVVVITGSGRGFCAGLDLAEPGDLLGGTRAERLDPYRWVGQWVMSIVHCDKPVIAAINGACAGAGFGLALACDLRVMQDDAKCTAGYIRRGLSPDAAVSWMLPRLIGQARATEIVLTGRDVTAQEAERIGLTSEVFSPDVFADSVRAYAARLASGPPVAFALTKRLLHTSSTSTLEAHLRDELTNIARCFGTKDVKEAMRAFGEKRMPVFTGE